VLGKDLPDLPVGQRTRTAYRALHWVETQRRIAGETGPTKADPSPDRDPLQETALREGQRQPAADHEVVQHPDVDQA